MHQCNSIALNPVQPQLDVMEYIFFFNFWLKLNIKTPVIIEPLQTDQQTNKIQTKLKGGKLIFDS